MDIITLVPKGMIGYRNSQVKSSSEDVLRNFMLPPHSSHSHFVQKCAQTQVQMLINSEKKTLQIKIESNTVKKEFMNSILLNGET